MNSLQYLVDIYKNKFGEKAKTIFDIGSRDGRDAKFLSDNLDSESIYTFEANPDCHLLIKATYPNFNNVYGAISNFVGTATFNMVQSENWDEVGTSSLKDRTDNWYENKAQKIELPVSTMENIINNYGITSIIDLVKLDVEGCSFEVLEGFGDKINQVRVFHIENETYAYWQEQKLAHEVEIYLTKKGFVKYDSRNFGPNSVDEVWINVNFI
jgi:hypothetical protein